MNAGRPDPLGQAPGPDRDALHRHIALVISSLGAGGAERVLTILAAAWVDRGYRVTVLMLAGTDEPVHWPLDARVELRALGLLRVSRHVWQRLRNSWSRVRVLRRAIVATRPDMIVAFMDTANILTLAATLRLRIPVVVAEHNDPYHERLPRRLAIARRLLYRRAAAITVLTERAARYFGQRLASRVHVIPNPIVAPDERLASGLGSDVSAEPVKPGVGLVVAMGRLVRQKGFDLLLDGFAQAALDRPGLRLAIHGEGPDRAALEAHRERLGLAGRVSLPGITRDPAGMLSAADVFVLSSRWEGFPTVLGEAMALGLPVVAFNCPSGPAEMIRDGVDGLLVPPGDVPGLAKALLALVDDPALRNAMAARAPEIITRFGLDHIVELWEALFTDLDIRWRVAAPMP